MFLRPRRPPVLDAARAALIPLRPLTIGEILDGAFLIVRRNIRLMVGLPLVVAGGTAAYTLLGVGLWLPLGDTTSRTAQIVTEVAERTGQRSLVVIITGLDEAAVTEGLVPVLGPLRRKHKVVIAAVADPRIDELAAGRADVGQVYTAAAAELDQSRRARTARTLRDLGLSVVQSPPDRFAPDLADHYLALKKAGQL